ncbi:hypothetical protein DIURU_003014 [Diutina rugosa]|uniref:Cell wall protein n=1 Tax=Diutina rugosa TaxID=5481 RepID=A0A642UMT6_DIURU|nr:uncharacterized protein DIURU_003014 [Diutina rugosa]KAA8901963.1 hypothetical protein DIURU_003014 [Diutina rugosa]
MRLSTTALLALASSVAADKLLTAINTRSGGLFHFTSNSIVGDEVHVNDKDGSVIEYLIKDDGSLQDNKTKKYLVLKDDGHVGVSDTPDDKNWEFTSSHYVSHKDAGGYQGCPNGDGKYYLYLGNDQCQGGGPFAIYATDFKDVGSSDDNSDDKKDEEDDKKDDQQDAADDKKDEEDDKKDDQQDVQDDKQDQEDDKKDDQQQAASVDAKDNFAVKVDAEGTDFQDKSIKKVGAHPHVFSVGGDDGRDLTLSLKSDGTLIDQDGRGIFVGDNGDVGNVDPFGEQQATGGFSISDDKLVYNGDQGFFACPGGENQFSLTVKGWDGCTGLKLKVE